MTGKALLGKLKNFFRTAKGVLKAIAPFVLPLVLGKREEEEQDFSSFDCQVFRDYMEVDYRCK